MPAPQSSPDDFVHLTAQELIYDDVGQKVTARGQVEFIYDTRVLKAMQVDYNLATEVVTARGDVVILEPNGDVHFAEELELTRDMSDGYVRALQTTLADGSRFWAASGQRNNGRTIVMRDAVYTPCTPCKTDPQGSPLWDLRAEKVTHDNVDKKISYQNVWFDLAGVPVLYAPYFSHPDGSVQQKSGFLTPEFKLNSRNGANVTGRYYWAIDPWRDATMGAQMFTKQGPRLTGEYRERFENAELFTAGSVTYSERKDREGTSTVVRNEELRGHIETKATWDMTDVWRSRLNLNLASDEQYLRQYDVTTEDVLENELYAERFSGRDYARVGMVGFQDLRTSTRRGDQPNIFPEAEASFYGEPASFLGGRWRLQGSALGLERSDGGDDMTRISTTVSWADQYTTGFGLVSTVDLMTRGDIYYAVNRAPGSPTESNKERLFPLAHMVTRYPLGRPIDGGMLTIEPIAALTLVPRLDKKQNDIPNEDSQDVQLDASNLFEASRFPGLDRVEDLSRAPYGGRASILHDDGGVIEAFLGQSWRFDSTPIVPFTANSGLANQTSDYVGRLKFSTADHTTIDYGFQVNAENGGSVRHELEAGKKINDLTLNVRYLYAQTIEGLGFTESREQAQVYGTYLFAPDWQVRGGVNYDLGANPGLRKTLWGIDYLGQCLTFSATIERNLTTDVSGDRGSELMLRLGLKNLGEFATSGIGLSSSSRDNDPDNSVQGLPVN